MGQILDSWHMPHATLMPISEFKHTQMLSFSGELSLSNNKYMSNPSGATGITHMLESKYIKYLVKPRL